MSRKKSLFKVVLLGDGGVGKSSLTQRFVSNRFDSQLCCTIGVEFLNKKITVDNVAFTLQIWDTAGQERFRSLRTPFYRGADLCLLTFSVDNVESFENLTTWKNEFIRYADIQSGDFFPFVVVGNKVDIPERLVSTRQAEEWCSKNGNCPYIETSAKSAINVEKAFVDAVRQMAKLESQLERNSGHPESRVDLREAHKSKPVRRNAAASGCDPC